MVDDNKPDSPDAQPPRPASPDTPLAGAPDLPPPPPPPGSAGETARDAPPPPDYSATPDDFEQAELRGDYRSRGENFRDRAEEATARMRGAAEQAQEQTRVHVDSARATISESEDRSIAIAAYILYLAVGVTGGIAAIAGVILAYVKKDTLNPVLASHLRFQIRTFWIGLAAGLAGLLLTIIFVGVLILIALAVWWLLRNVVGLIRLVEGKPIHDPKTWLV